MSERRKPAGLWTRFFAWFAFAFLPLTIILMLVKGENVTYVEGFLMLGACSAIVCACAVILDIIFEDYDWKGKD